MDVQEERSLLLKVLVREKSRKKGFWKLNRKSAPADERGRRKGAFRGLECIKDFIRFKLRNQPMSSSSSFTKRLFSKNLTSMAPNQYPFTYH